MTAKVGDVVFFEREGSHVGIYAGDGFAIAADVEGGYVADTYLLPVRRHGPGVVYVPCPKPSKVVDIPWGGNTQLVVSWLHEQMGKRYDFVALLLQICARALRFIGIRVKPHATTQAFTDASLVAQALIKYRGANPTILNNRAVTVHDLEKFLVA